MRSQIYLPAVSDKIRNSLSSPDFRVKIRNAVDGSVELLIFDGIGDEGTTSTTQNVAAFLARNRGKAVNVRINSPGGFAFDGIQIFNALSQHDGFVTTTTEGIAASAAAIIAQAGDRRRIFDNASMLVHRASGLAVGNVDDMRAMSEFLAQLDNQISSTLATRTGKSSAEMLRLMTGPGKRDGTTFDAAEALKERLVDEIIRTGGRGPGNRSPSSPEARARRLREIERDTVLCGM